MFWIGLFVGTIIGWTFPQPQWSKNLVAWAKSKLSGY